MVYALSDTTPDIGNLRETFFYALTRVTHVPLSSRWSDFTIGNYTFEVGDKNKGTEQISEQPNAYIEKDDIETVGLTTLALWTFGMMIKQIFSEKNNYQIRPISTNHKNRKR